MFHEVLSPQKITPLTLTFFYTPSMQFSELRSNLYFAEQVRNATEIANGCGVWCLLSLFVNMIVKKMWFLW